MLHDIIYFCFGSSWRIIVSVSVWLFSGIITIRLLNTYLKSKIRKAIWKRSSHPIPTIDIKDVPVLVPFPFIFGTLGLIIFILSYCLVHWIYLPTKKYLEEQENSWC
jgi:hypothetical protein